MALNSSFTKHEHLYAEVFDVPAPTSNVVKAETEQEKEERLEIEAQNRQRFDDHVKSNVKDQLDQQLFYNAPVLDIRTFNSKLHRPLTPREGFIKALVELGVDCKDAEEMAVDIGEFPVDRKDAKKVVCKHSCDVCHQHQLVDGTLVRGFMPIKNTLGLTLYEDFCDWQLSNPRYGDRHGRGKRYVMDMCQRCWQLRQPSQRKSNNKKKRNRRKMTEDFKFHSLQRSDYDAGSMTQKRRDDLVTYCSVHRTAIEKELWSKFGCLQDELDAMADAKAIREHKACTIR